TVGAGHGHGRIEAGQLHLVVFPIPSNQLRIARGVPEPIPGGCGMRAGAPMGAPRRRRTQGGAGGARCEEHFGTRHPGLWPQRTNLTVSKMMRRSKASEQCLM